MNDNEEKYCHYIISDMMYKSDRLRSFFQNDTKIVITMSTKLKNILLSSNKFAWWFEFSLDTTYCYFYGYETHFVLDDKVWFSVGTKDEFDL